MDYALLGWNIKQRRIACGLTQQALAEESGLSPSFIGHIERGSRIPSLETMAIIACVLDTTIDALLPCTGAHAGQAGSMEEIRRLLMLLLKLTENQ